MLIKCPECKKEISDTAPSCIHCGYLMKASFQGEQMSEGIKCPTCNSTNIEKISAAKKAAYVGAVGILAPLFKKVRSQFECKNCGYKW